MGSTAQGRTLTRLAPARLASPRRGGVVRAGAQRRPGRARACFSPCFPTASRSPSCVCSSGPWCSPPVSQALLFPSPLWGGVRGGVSCRRAFMCSSQAEAVSRRGRARGLPQVSLAMRGRAERRGRKPRSPVCGVVGKHTGHSRRRLCRLSRRPARGVFGLAPHAPRWTDRCYPPLMGSKRRSAGVLTTPGVAASGSQVTRGAARQGHAAWAARCGAGVSRPAKAHRRPPRAS